MSSVMHLDLIAQFADAMEIKAIEKHNPELKNAAQQLRLLGAGMQTYMDKDWLLAMEHRKAQQINA